MASHAQFEIKRHYSDLSEKESDAVVGMVADLIVSYLKRTSGSGQRAPGDAKATRDKHSETREVRS